jgi:chemotaxis protein CheC
MMNTAMGQAANAMSSLLERRVLLTVPKVEIMQAATLREFLERRISAAGACIRQPFQGQLVGDAALIFPIGHAEILMHVVLDQPEQTSFSEVERAVLAEIGNVVLNAAIARLGDQLDARLAIGMPTVTTHLSLAMLLDALRAAPAPADHAIVLLSRLAVGEVHLVVYLIIQLPQPAIRRLLASLEA